MTVVVTGTPVQDPTIVVEPTSTMTPTPVVVGIPTVASVPAHQATTFVHTAHGTINSCSYPARVTCPNCNNVVVSVVHYEPGTVTWLFAILLGIFFWICCCCFIPFAVDDMKDAVHTCPQCSVELGSKRRM